MANTSARALLDRIASGQPWTREEVAQAASDPALFRDLIEPLADSFDPAMVDAYVRVFGEIVEHVHPDLPASALAERFAHVRRPRKFAGPDPRTVFVLSRVTLGADVAITSVVLDAVLQRFRNTAVFFVGPRKSWELFAANQRVQLLAAPYHRTATLEERLRVSRALELPFRNEDALVLDPDSRLSQLGLMPICPEHRHVFLDTRSPGVPGSLSAMAARWMADTFGVSARPWIAPPMSAGMADITVSLGVGGNEAKRLPDPFERRLMEMLSATGRPVLVDTGAEPEEAARVSRAIEGLPNIETYHGEFAPFAGAIARSWLYVGYDSAGQHVAAAAATRLISVFSGYPNPRFLERWRPTGRGHIHVIDAKDRDPEHALAAVEQALKSL